MLRIAEETIDDREEATIDEFITFLQVTSRKHYPTGTIPRFNQGRAERLRACVIRRAGGPRAG